MLIITSSVNVDTFLYESAATGQPEGAPPDHQRRLGGRAEADHRVPSPDLASLSSLVLENHLLDTDSGLREHRHTSWLVPENKTSYQRFSSKAKQGYIFSLAGVWSVALLLFSSQGCCISSEALILCLASLTSNLVMKSLASSKMWAKLQEGKTEWPSFNKKNIIIIIIM